MPSFDWGRKCHSIDWTIARVECVWSGCDQTSPSLCTMICAPMGKFYIISTYPHYCTGPYFLLFVRHRPIACLSHTLPIKVPYRPGRMSEGRDCRFWTWCRFSDIKHTYFSFKPFFVVVIYTNPHRAPSSRKSRSRLNQLTRVCHPRS